MAGPAYPFTSFNFAVEINRGQDGRPLVSAAFQECDGLEMTMEVKTIREGGANDRQIRLNGQVAYGQRRVLVVWTRLIMPNGTSIILDRLPASDTQGYAGLEDKVDYHWGRLIAGAAISTLLGVNAELVTDNAAASSGSVVIATRQSSQDTVNQIGQEITRRNLDIQPTLSERPGLPLRIVVNRDLILQPYGS